MRYNLNSQHLYLPISNSDELSLVVRSSIHINISTSVFELILKAIHISITMSVHK